MANMTYSIKEDKRIVAQCDSTVLAAHIAALLTQHSPKIRVVNNIYNRVAFYSKDGPYTSGLIKAALVESAQRFTEDFNRKYRS